MSGHGTVEENIAEMDKWRKVSYVAVPFCAILAAYIFGTAAHHEHHEKAVRIMILLLLLLQTCYILVIQYRVDHD